jgi:hypothetical protein
MCETMPSEATKERPGLMCLNSEASHKAHVLFVIVFECIHSYSYRSLDVCDRRMFVSSYQLQLQLQLQIAGCM